MIELERVFRGGFGGLLVFFVETRSDNQHVTGVEETILTKHEVRELWGKITGLFNSDSTSNCSPEEGGLVIPIDGFLI